MTEAADQIRDRRQLWARPGGSHDRMVRILARWLPGMVGVVAAIMIVGPLFPKGEISFLLDRNKVAMTKDRMRVTNAMYRGEDNQGRPFTLTAGSAVQASVLVPVVVLRNLAARIRMTDGPAQLTAVAGNYDYAAETVSVNGLVQFSAADGYRMTTSHVLIDLNSRKVLGSGQVAGTVPAGTFSAERIMADLEARTVALEGNARLLMTPGKLRVPQ